MKNIPILNLSKILLDVIEREKELKLTKSGYLPVKVVNELYHAGVIQNKYNETRLNRAKTIREEDDMAFVLTRSLLEASGVIKKRNNKLSLTRSGEKLNANEEQLLHHLLSFYGLKYDWSIQDGYGSNEIGSYGFAYSLVLLGLYGVEKRADQFYAEKYFKAFPWLMNNTNYSRYMSKEENSYSCYSYRTVNIFLFFFGLAHIEEVHQLKPVYSSETDLTKTDLFDKMFEVKQPNP